MKSNISFYRHEVGSHNHWKFKTLRRKYEWSGEGKFWALNNMIAESEECRLDISDTDKKTAIATELDFDALEFEKYLQYLIEVCKLVAIDDGCLLTGITQEIYLEVNEKRERQRNWKKGKSTTILPNSTAKTPESTTKVAKSTVDFEQSKVKEKKEKKIKVNTTVGVPAAPSPPKVGRRVEETEVFWQELVKTWFDFVQKKFGEPPLFAGEDPKFLKSIITKLKARAKQKGVDWTAESSVARFGVFLTHAYGEDWLRKNFMLKQLDSQFEKVGRAVKKEATAAVNLQFIYELFCEGKPVYQLMAEDHFKLVDLPWQDCWENALSQRLKSLVGSNQAREVRLLDAYQHNRDTADTQEDMAYVEIIAKKMALMNYFTACKRNKIEILEV